MKQYKLLYAILLLGIIFLLIFINKKLFLEGYTYNADLTFNGSPQQLPGSFTDTNNKVKQTTCEVQCNSMNNCTGFTTTDINHTKGNGTCRFYSHSKNDLRNLVGTNIFLK